MADFTLIPQACDHLHTVDAISATLIPPLHQYDTTTLYTAENTDTGCYNSVDGLWDAFDVIFGTYEYAAGQYTSAWGYVRIPNVQVDQGASIKSAILKLTASTSKSGTPLGVRIHVNLEADSDAPESDAEFLEIVNSTQSAQFVSWSVSAWLDGTQYNSADIAPLIESVVALPGWERGNAILLVINPNIGGSPDKWRQASAHSVSAEKPELYLEYSNNNTAHIHTADNVALTQKHVLSYTDDRVKSLLHFDGADESTTFTDDTGKVWTVNGNAKIDTAQSKFGGASGYFDGIGDYLSIAAPLDGSFNFGVDAFTIHFWVRGDKNPWSNADALLNLGTWGGASTGAISLYPPYFNWETSGNSSSTGIGDNWKPTYNVWQHVAIVREANGTAFKLYVDGTLKSTYAVASGSTFNIVDPSYIAKSDSYYGKYYIDEFCMIKGVALWTSDFTPPASPCSITEPSHTQSVDNVSVNLHLAPQSADQLHTVDAIGTFKVAAVDATETLYPATQNDDGTDTNNTLTLDAVSLIMGHYSGYSSSVFIRFDGVNIERLQQVQNAYVCFTAYGSTSGAACKLRIYAVGDDDADAPTNDTEWDALTQTTAYVDWEPAAWTDDTTYDSPNIASVIQEVVNRAGWTGLSAIVIQLLDNSSDVGAYRRASSYDYNSGAQKPELHLEWISAGRWHTQTVDGALVLVEHKDLVVAETYHAHAVDNISAMFVGVNLTGASCDHLHTVDSVTIVVDLVVASCDHLHTVDDINQTLASVGIQAADHVHTVDGLLLLTQEHTLAVQGADHLQTSEAQIGVHIPAVAGCDQLHTVDGITGTLIWVHPDHDEPYHIQAVESPALTQDHTLVAQGSDQLQSVDNIDVQHLVISQEAYHEMVADSIALTQQHTLVVQEAYHLHVPDYGIKIQWAVRVDEEIQIWESIDLGWILTLAESLDISETVTEQLGWKIKESLVASETVLNQWSGVLTIEELIKVYHALGFTWNMSAEEAAALSESVVAELGLRIKEYLSIADSLSSTWYGTITVEETLKAFGTLAICEIFNETAAEALTITDTSSFVHRMISSIAESLGVSEVVTPLMTYNPLITEALGVAAALTAIRTTYLTNAESLEATDTLSWQWNETVAESVKATDTATLAFYAVLALTESLKVTETVLNTLQVDETLAEALEIVASLTAQQKFNLSIEESITASIKVLLDDEVWECWVLNGNQFAPSVYSGFDFNSYTVFGNAAYGCKDDGIYELTGATDQGTAITAGIVLPETYFGVQRVKRFRKAYFGLSGTSPSIRMETDSGSKTYTISDSKANLTRDLYGRQWTLKLQSFTDVQFIELWPVILTR